MTPTLLGALLPVCAQLLCQAVPTRVTWLVGAGPLMVRIPAGSFVRGSTHEEVTAAAASCAAEPLGHRCTAQTFWNELGRRRVSLGTFWMDRTEVTVREYERCVVAGRCAMPGWAAGGERFRKPNFPVTFVSYFDAEEYCRYRGARLPSELMFERASRGRDGRPYPWGRLYNARAANHGRLAILPSDDSDGAAELAEVGSYPAGRTPDGLLDLAGNVAEWTSDPYRERYDEPVPASSTTARRAVRGGSFASAAAWMRGAARQGFAPDTRRPDLGFRCAQDIVSAEGSPP